MTPPPSLAELIQTVQQDSPSPGSLDLLVTASSTVSQIEDLNDALLEHFVSACRREGRSWSEISAALGVSKQAVHKRFSAPIADRIVANREPTFERFTLRARKALQAAVQAARGRGSATVEPGDLLAGLFTEPEGLAAQVLTAMGVTALGVRAALGHPADAAGAGTPAGPGAQAGPDAANGGTRPPFAPEAATALRDALAEALELGHNYIGTEHILLGLMRDPDAPVTVLLSQLGASPAEARVRITELLRGFSKGTPSTP
jgi:ATP-dependent Clp protease ATP-binding subunit ClpA